MNVLLVFKRIFWSTIVSSHAMLMNEAEARTLKFLRNVGSERLMLLPG